jgi:hypothetical protein
LLNSAKFHEITDSVIFLSSSKLVRVAHRDPRQKLRRGHSTLMPIAYHHQKLWAFDDSSH